MSNVVGKEACPECQANGADNSGDNLARYDDGGAYCFACGHNERADGQSRTSSSSSKPSGKAPLLGDLEIRGLRKRGINAETCQHFGYAIGDYHGKSVHVAPYRNSDGQVIAQKLRDAKKNFKFVGEPKKVGLFGQHLWRDGGKKVCVTEGEIDALSMSQLQNNKWPVVSVPNGAQGASRTIAQEIEWLETFDQVIFMFDMDEPGQAAAKECAALLSPGKAFIARLPMKDANMCLMEGKGKELLDSMWGAKAFRPDGVIDIAEVVDKAALDIVIGLPWPWESLTRKTYGRRRAELYGFGAGTGIGKSTVFKQIAKHVVEVDQLPVGLLMLEEPPHMTAKTLAGMFMQQRVHIPGVEYDKDELRQTLLSLSERVFLYDHFGSMQWKTVKQRIRYMVRGLGIKDIFLDHLTALAAAIDDMDERKAIDKIMAELSALTQELDCTIYYISHLTTPDGKPHEEGGRVFEKHFRGSRSIAYWSHFMFALERDKQSDDPTTFRVLKDRYTGDAAGLTFGLRYDTTKGLYDECELPRKGDDCGFKPEADDEY